MTKSKDVIHPGAMVDTGFSLNYLDSFTFEGQALPWFNIEGVPHVPTWIVGKLLGYAEGGSKLARMFSQEWDDAEDGVEYRTLSGQMLADLKAVCEAAGLGTEIVPSRAPSLHMLTQAGVDLACMNSHKEVGKRMKLWLRREVFPAIRKTGSYREPALPAPDSTAIADPRLAKEMRALESLRVRAERERRLAAVEDRKQREMKVRGYTMQYEAVAAVNPPSPAVDAAFRKFIGSVLAGGDLAEAASATVPRALPSPDGAPMDLTITASAHFMSVTEGAESIGISANHYGRLVKRIGAAEGVDYLAGVDGLTRAKVGMTKTTAAGFQMAIPQYEVTTAMNEKVAAALRDERDAVLAAAVAKMKAKDAEKAARAAAKEAAKAERAAKKAAKACVAATIEAPDLFAGAEANKGAA